MSQMPASTANTASGGQLLIDGLTQFGVERIFAVPGESYLAALDALVDAPQIELITCRQEGGAAMMAEAYGKLTGRPGVCFVTRGPGATNASAGVHVARQDSTPLVLFIGQVGRDMLDREAFQEIDYRRMYGQLAKWVAQIDHPARIPEYLSRAFHLAVSGRPGPVVLVLPEDMLRERSAKAPALASYRAIQAQPGEADLSRLRELLAGAKRPLVLLGEADWNSQACADLEAFVSANRLPVAATFRCQDLFNNDHPCYVGDLGLGSNPRLIERVRSADLLLALGGRLGEIPTGGYTLLDVPQPAQTLVHVFPGSDELNRVYRAELAIQSGLRAFAAAARRLEPVVGAWAVDETAGAEIGHRDYLAWSEPPDIPGPLQLGRIVCWLRDRLPPEAIVCNGAGNYSIWVHRFYRYRQFRSQLAPTSGSMGYGLPAAIAAKLQHPQRPVVCFAGDGCFQMTLQEFATAVQYHANVIVLLINNGAWGTIRMHQEKAYPRRVKGTSLVNPDFAALAQAYGGFGEVVEQTADFAAKFAAAQRAERPALLELRVPLEALTPGTSLSQTRAAAEGA